MYFCRFLQRQKPSSTLSGRRAKPRSCSRAPWPAGSRERHWVEEWAVLQLRFLSFYGMRAKKPHFSIAVADILRAEEVPEDAAPFQGFGFFEIHTLGRVFCITVVNQELAKQWVRRPLQQRKGGLSQNAVTHPSCTHTHTHTHTCGHTHGHTHTHTHTHGHTHTHAHTHIRSHTHTDTQTHTHTHTHTHTRGRGWDEGQGRTHDMANNFAVYGCSLAGGEDPEQDPEVVRCELHLHEQRFPL